MYIKLKFYRCTDLLHVQMSSTARNGVSQAIVRPGTIASIVTLALSNSSIRKSTSPPNATMSNRQAIAHAASSAPLRMWNVS